MAGHALRGFAYKRLGNTEQANMEFARAKEIDPEFDPEDDESDDEVDEENETEEAAETDWPVMQLSSALARVVGSDLLKRTEVTERLWAYIKANNLQDKDEPRTINADANLKVLFGGRASVNMVEMTKLVSKHLKTATTPKSKS